MPSIINTWTDAVINENGVQPFDAEAEIAALKQSVAGVLPEVAKTDEGKVLTVDKDGEWVAADVPKELPAVTALADEGKVLTVDSEGAWAAANVPTELPAVTAAEDEGKVLTVNSEGEWAAAALPADDPQQPEN